MTEELKDKNTAAVLIKKKKNWKVIPERENINGEYLKVGRGLE